MHLQSGFFIMKMYFIAIVLPNNLNAPILKLKQWMHEDWGCKVGLKSPAHLTLVPPFWMDETLEQSLLQDLDGLGAQLSSFEVATNNFSAFKPRTIFIATAPNEALAKAKKVTDQFIKERPQYGAKVDNRPFHPHITIATRDLRKSAFSEAWPRFESDIFQETFLADGISLLRHNGQLWEVAHTSLFGA